MTLARTVRDGIAVADLNDRKQQLCKLFVVLRLSAEIQVASNGLTVGEFLEMLRENWHLVSSAPTDE
jgi:hypothetical protein